MPSVLESLMEEISSFKSGAKGGRSVYKHDTPGAPITVGYSHGPGGHLTFPGVDPQVFHTVVGNIGILGTLPTKSSVFTNPTYQVLTGVLGDSGSEKEDVCDNAPYGGLMKTCMLTSVFGRYERSTPEIELNRLGQLNDRADPMDLRLVGSPIHQSGIFASGPGDPGIPGDVFTNEIARKMFELGLSFHRQISVQIWRGNPANNSAGGGYKELTGLDILINTGHIDAENNTSCPSLDSDLKNFNYARVDADPDGLVNAISYLYRTRKSLALRTSVMPVRWVLAMRDELFWEITKIWPCSYLTYQCQVTGQERVNINAADQVAMRDAMRQGQYLLIDGEKVEVILDDGIREWTNTDNANVTSGCMSSDIYLIPMSVAGGQASLFLEYFDYGNPSAQSAIAAMNNEFRVEGAFITTWRRTNWCLQLQSKIEPRLVLRTPWLAGRLQNVQYCPLQHIRTPFPGDPYNVDGGRTSRPAPSYFNLWDQRD